MKIIVIALLVSLCTTFSFAQSESATSYIDKANEKIEKKEYKEALDILSFAISEMPDSMNLYSMRGSLFQAFKLYDKAILDYSLGIEKAYNLKNKAFFLSNRGEMKVYIMDYEGAYNDFIQAIETDSTNLDALNNLAAVCDEVNKPNETLKYLNQVIKVDSNYVPAYVNIGFKYQVMGKYQESIKFFDKAIKLAPNKPLGYSNRSYSKFKIGDIKEALEDVNYSIELFPTNSYAYKIRALILIEKNKLKKACADLKIAKELGYANQYGNEVAELKAKYCK
ncbi:tetratricopeptide repeat protein [Bernardetia sp. ABR2-2B]|uniref:tetratricopeptide repeat protein n=1 Tax=Bernardetia sp. ABR2-2B TaxID=3127472 RepID=UPI0030D400A7